VHAEIFFDPQTHTARGVPLSVVVEGITEALSHGRAKLGVSSHLIMCFLRHLGPEAALTALEEVCSHSQCVQSALPEYMRACRGCMIVGSGHRMVVSSRMVCVVNSGPAVQAAHQGSGAGLHRDWRPPFSLPEGVRARKPGGLAGCSACGCVNPIQPSHHPRHMPGAILLSSCSMVLRSLSQRKRCIHVLYFVKVHDDVCIVACTPTVVLSVQERRVPRSMSGRPSRCWGSTASITA
jgi:hypothetical protein